MVITKLAEEEFLLPFQIKLIRVMKHRENISFVSFFDSISFRALSKCRDGIECDLYLKIARKLLIAPIRESAGTKLTLSFDDGLTQQICQIRRPHVAI